MKLDRMLGIVHVLSQADRVRARDLAERFEVSLRTIHRDVEAICMAGIPVVTYPGGHGGIGLAPGYRLDSKALTKNELQSILTGLKGLESIGYSDAPKKLQAMLSPAGLTADIAGTSSPDVLVPVPDLHIDLASHAKGRLAPAIRTLRDAIAARRVVRLVYISGSGPTERTLEPCYIAFRWAAWYVAGWCRLRDDFRMFRINRILEMSLTEETYTPRALPAETTDPERMFSQKEEDVAVLLVHPSAEYRILDEFGPGSYRRDASGWLLFSFPYVNREWILGFIFSLADKARVLAPATLAETVRLRAEAMAAMYR